MWAAVIVRWNLEEKASMDENNGNRDVVFRSKWKELHR